MDYLVKKELKKTIHRLILVNSAYREKVVFPNPNRFTIELPNNLKNVTGLWIRDFFTYQNEAEYLIIVVRQLKCSKMISPDESPWQIPSSAIFEVETLSKDTGNIVGGRPKYVNNSTMKVCFDNPIGVVKQLDIEVYGRVSTGHVPLIAPVPIILFPFTVPDHEWSAIFDFECELGDGVNDIPSNAY